VIVFFILTTEMPGLLLHPPSLLLRPPLKYKINEILLTLFSMGDFIYVGTMGGEGVKPTPPRIFFDMDVLDT